MNGAIAVYYREMLLLRRKLRIYLASMAVSPVLYLIAFGLAAGRGASAGGHPYMEFLIPGIVALGGMTQAFGIGAEINVARFHWRVFEEFQAAPISNFAYVAGEVSAGVTRAILGALVILSIAALGGIVLQYGFFFWVGVFLNAFFFAGLAVCLAMVVKNHTTQMLLNNFVITPMAFLGGTFFPLDRLPESARLILGLLPITQASTAIRAAALHGGMPMKSLGILLLFGIAVFGLGLVCVNKARD